MYLFLFDVESPTYIFYVVDSYIRFYLSDVINPTNFYYNRL